MIKTPHFSRGLDGVSQQALTRELCIPQKLNLPATEQTMESHMDSLFLPLSIEQKILSSTKPKITHQEVLMPFEFKIIGKQILSTLENSNVKTLHVKNIILDHIENEKYISLFRNLLIRA